MARADRASLAGTRWRGHVAAGFPTTGHGSRGNALQPRQPLARRPHRLDTRPIRLPSSVIAQCAVWPLTRRGVNAPGCGQVQHDVDEPFPGVRARPCSRALATISCRRAGSASNGSCASRSVTGVTSPSRALAAPTSARCARCGPALRLPRGISTDGKPSAVSSAIMSVPLVLDARDGSCQTWDALARQPSTSLRASGSPIPVRISGVQDPSGIRGIRSARIGRLGVVRTADAW